MTTRHKLWCLCLCLVPVLALQFSCSSLFESSIGKYYRKCTRPMSYYRSTYCFEVGKKDALEAVQWVLKRASYPLKSDKPVNSGYETTPILMPRYSCNKKWAYVVGVNVKVEESKGKLNLSSFPKWVFLKKTPKLPQAPQRKNFKTLQAFDTAYQAYLASALKRSETLNKYVTLMSKWQGCNIRTSKQRSLVSVTLKVTGYPVDNFGNINKKKPKTIRPDRTLEYATLREVGKRLGKMKFMPAMRR